MHPSRIFPMLLLLVFLPLAAVAATEPSSNETPTASKDDFVQVDLSKEPSIDGKAHAIAAFAIVIGFLVIYSYSLLHREREIRKNIALIKKRP